jgi:hypothetical protein
MQMIGQQHPGVDAEFVALTHALDCVAHRLTYVIITEKCLAAVGDDREEIGATRSLGSAIATFKNCSRVGNELPTLLDFTKEQVTA